MRTSPERNDTRQVPPLGRVQVSPSRLRQIDLDTHNFPVISQFIAKELSIRTAPDDLFRTLADPTRRALFERLCRDGDQIVGALTAGVGVSQPAVSKHLAALKRAGLVRDHPEGRQTRYSAEPAALAPLTGWADEMTRFWEARLGCLEDLLRRMDQ